LHARDYVVGDLNESNVLVKPTALVTVIDTDSFQVKERRESQIVFYPCPVGKPEYTAPELQGTSFQGEVRQPYHDAFALGVLIFQLLMGGSHPFRSRWLGSGEPPLLEEKIRRGWFPYAIPPSEMVAPPHHVLPLDAVHPEVKDLLLRCFVEGHHNPMQRPSAEEWARALDKAEQALVECRGGHCYAQHVQSCPWCGREAELARTVAGRRHTPARRNAARLSMSGRQAVLRTGGMGSSRGRRPLSRSIVHHARLPVLGLFAIGVIVTVITLLAAGNGGRVQVVDAPPSFLGSAPTPAVPVAEVVDPTVVATPAVVPTATTVATPSPTPQATATATSTRQPTSEPARATAPPISATLPVATVAPTALAAILPTATAVPAPDTPAGTVLEEGQTWRQGGWELALVSLQYADRTICPQFRLTNGTALEQVVRYSLQDFQAVDDRGRRLMVAAAAQCGAADKEDWDSGPIVIPAGGQMNLDSGGTLQLQASQSGLSPKEITIAVSGVASITEARWRFRVAY